jgi:hypothetical protein
MKFFRMGLLVGMVFGITGAAVAQSPMQLLSTVRLGQPIPQDCLAEANALQLHLAQSAQPKGWVNVLACDEVAWEKALEAPGQRIAYQGNALLDFTTRTKVFNAAEYPVQRIKAIEPRIAIAAAKGSSAPVVVPHLSVPAM